MAPNLKLTTLTWIFALFGAITISLIFTISFLIQQNLSFINDSWKLYQTDLCQKSRLESAIRGSVGYGGMIHNYKNYKLRFDNRYLKLAESQLNSTVAMLKQYRALELNTAEKVAIDDILIVLTKYKKALQEIQLLINKNYTVSEIHQAVKVNDQIAIRGFQVLREAVISKQEKGLPLSKSRIIADLRSALGYDGMIHKFKSYLLNHNVNAEDNNVNQALKDEVEKKIKLALGSINQYKQLSLNKSESIALNDIEYTVKQYQSKLYEISKLIQHKPTMKELDSIVRVDDESALRGFQILEAQINHDIHHHSLEVSKALKEILNTVSMSKWIGSFTIFLVTLLSILVVRFYVIEPIIRLTKNMVKLANNNLDTEISEYQKTNEVGQMASTVKIFKKNLLKLIESEDNYAKANKLLKQQLEENKQLRQESVEQTNKALTMAEHMAEARIAAESAMDRAEKDELFVSSILNAVRDGIITINAHGIIETFNPGSEDIFGYRAHEVIGKNISILMPEPLSSEHDGYIKRFVDGNSNRDQGKPLEQLALRKNGETFPAEVSLNTIRVGNELKITGVVRDVTERKRKESQIQKLAMTDSLTGLANRNQFENRLNESLNMAKRYQQKFCLMTLDLDKFKPVNDNYGHFVGDHLLQKIAEILVENCRETDTIARLGGDEFTIILPVVNNAKEIENLAQRIIEKVGQPFSVDKHTVQVGASIGVSCYPDNSDDIEELQKMADKALYQAKNAGRSCYRFFSMSNQTS